MPTGTIRLGHLLGNLTLLGALACSACDSAAENRSPAQEQAAADTIRPAPVSQPEAEDSVTASAPFAVAIDSEGLRLVEMATGRTTPLPFGTEQSRVLGALRRLWGPWRERSELPDCAADPPTLVTWSNGLIILLQNDEFRGWSMSHPRPEGDASAFSVVETMAGIGIESTRGDLEATYDIQVSTTSLGAEFDAGDLHGLLSDTTSAATVTALWAGTVCIFR